MCARRRSNFLLSRQEKVTKEKATLLSASLRFAAGNLRCSFAGCAVELALRLRRAARTTTASQITKRVCPAAHPPPRALRSSAHTEGAGKVQTAARAIALLGLACAARGACARECRGERSDGPCGLRSSNPLLAAPAAGRFFASLLIARQERRSPAGARPGLRPQPPHPAPLKERFMPRNPS